MTLRPVSDVSDVKALKVDEQAWRAFDSKASERRTGCRPNPMFG
jgi:hypothetical protein